MSIHSIILRKVHIGSFFFELKSISEKSLRIEFRVRGYMCRRSQSYEQLKSFVLVSMLDQLLLESLELVNLSLIFGVIQSMLPLGWNLPDRQIEFK